MTGRARARARAVARGQETAAPGAVRSVYTEVIDTYVMLCH